jgi:hypothetical protein
MPSDKFVAYYCVNAGRKGRKGDGLERQRAAVMSYLNGGHWTLLERHTETEEAGRRPVLAHALAACREHKAALVVADPGHLEQDDGFMAELTRAGVECWGVETGPFDRPKAKPLGRREDGVAGRHH